MASVFARPFLWCCAGCIRGDDESVEYYTLLGVDQFASQEEIRKEWRKISLRMHPDKLAQRGQTVGPKEQEEFTKIKDAHSVLCDPVRRQIYDHYGANGVKWMEDPSTINPEVLMKNFTKSTTTDRCRVVTVFFLLFMVVLSSPIMLCFKLDGNKSIPWLLVFAPVLVFQLIVLVAQLVGVKKLEKTIRQQDEKRRKQNNQKKDGLAENDESVESGRVSDEESDDDTPLDDSMKWERQYVLTTTRVGCITSALNISWQLLLALKLQWEHFIGFCSFGELLLPLLLAELYSSYSNHHASKEALKAANDIPHTTPTTSAENGESKENRHESQKLFRRMMAESAKKSVSAHLLRACFVIFLMFKIDGDGMNWWVVFLPVWLLFGFECMFDAKQFMGDEAKAEEFNPMSVVLHACCAVGITCAMVVMICSKLAGATFSPFWIFFPVFFIAGCLLCCITCAVCCTVDTGDLTSQEGAHYSPLVDSQGRTAQAERPPTPERGRPPKNYLSTSSHPTRAQAEIVSSADIAALDTKVDKQLFHSPPLQTKEKSPVLNDID